MTSFKNRLIKMDACQEAIDWIGNRGLKRAWHESTRADHMLWLCAKLGIEHKLIVLAGCDCAETALQYVPKDEDRPLLAIQTSRNWCAGTATIDEVRTAAYAAQDATSYAADAAAYAAYATYATYAAAYATYATSAAAYAAVRAPKNAQKTCADLVWA